MVRVEVGVGSAVSVEILFLRVSDFPFHSDTFDKAVVNYKTSGSVMASLPWSSHVVAHSTRAVSYLSQLPHMDSFSFVWWREKFHMVHRPLIRLLYRARMIDEYGTIGGLRIVRGNRSTRRIPAPVPLCPSQIPHDFTWDRTRTAAVGSRRLTAWAMARLCSFCR
jgi:hypothetical protein